MVYCGCGKAIEKIPVWMKDIRVEFVCNNCPNRHTKNITSIDLNGPATDNVSGPESLAKVEEEEE